MRPAAPAPVAADRRGVDTIEAVLGGSSAAKANGSAFSGSSSPSRAEDLEFVVAARRCAPGTKISQIAVAAHAHRMAAAVPVVEVADHADASVRWAPARRSDAGDTLDLSGCAPSLS